MERGRSKDLLDRLILRPELTRRELLLLGVAGAGLLAVPEPLRALSWVQEGTTAIPPGGLGGGPLRIDAHAHIFNARDIAVAGLLRQIGTNSRVNLFERFMRSLLFFLIPDKYEDALTGLLHLLATRAAPTIEDEQRALAALLERTGGADTEAARTAFFQIVAEENRALDLDVEDIVRRAMTRLLEKSFTERERNQVIRFMTRLVAMRYQNAARLLELYGTAAAEGGPEGITLFTPAMVDLSLWLGDDSRFPMEEHLKLYATISRLAGGRLLPFVAFDPWRQAFGGKDGADRGRPMDWVRQAVEQYGFAGVKLFPAMGFHPFENSRHDSRGQKHWPRAARSNKQFGEGLDDALGELYSWCEANGVPVQVHGNVTMAAHGGYGRRGRPRQWEKVLRRFPDLRLNLGHFGGWYDAEAGKGWSRGIARLMERYEHVYADLGAFDLVDLPKRNRKLGRGLASLLRKHPVVAERLLYGSDWFMATSPEYLADFEEVLRSPGLEKLREGFFGGNSFKFLGLGPGELNRARLDAYYRTAGLAPAWQRKAQGREWKERAGS